MSFCWLTNYTIQVHVLTIAAYITCIIKNVLHARCAFYATTPNRYFHKVFIYFFYSIYRSCNDCMSDLYCGYCYVDLPQGAANASCLQAEYNNPTEAVVGRCNSSYPTKGHVLWAYDYCPTDFSWMPMAGLVLYLIFFAPGK